MADATAEDLLGGMSGWKRELKSAEVEGIGTVYYYMPASVAEREQFQRHVRYDEHGMSVSMEGVVDGIIARVKNAAGKPLFKQIHRSRLMEMPQDRLMAIWAALGGDGAMQSADDLVESAEKK